METLLCDDKWTKLRPITYSNFTTNTICIHMKVLSVMYQTDHSYIKKQHFKLVEVEQIESELP